LAKFLNLLWIEQNQLAITCKWDLALEIEDIRNESTFLKTASGHHRIISHQYCILITSAGPLYSVTSISCYISEISCLHILHFSTIKMQFSNLFITLLLSAAVAAKVNKTNTVTDKSLCNEMASLTKLLAANETKLAGKTKNNATKIVEIQPKASDASTQLTTMQANTTLVSTCAVISAVQDTEDSCSEMKPPRPCSQPNCT
jgi:hypothetical protein